MSATLANPLHIMDATQARAKCASVGEIVAIKHPDDWIVSLLVHDGPGKPYVTKVVNVTAGCEREAVMGHVLRCLGMQSAKPGQYIVKSIEKRGNA